MAESLSSPSPPSKEDHHPPQEQEREREEVHHYHYGPRKLLQEALIALLKCLGLEGSTLNTSSSSEKQQQNDEGKSVVVYEQGRYSSEVDFSLPTGEVQGGVVSTLDDPPSWETDPPPADDPPPSTGAEEEADTSARSAFRAPSRLPINTGSGPQKN